MLKVQGARLAGGNKVSRVPYTRTLESVQGGSIACAVAGCNADWWFLLGVMSQYGGEAGVSTGIFDSDEGCVYVTQQKYSTDLGWFRPVE